MNAAQTQDRTEVEILHREQEQAMEFAYRAVEHLDPEIIESIDEYLARGGTIKQLPAEIPDPKKFQDVRIHKDEKADKLSGYTKGRPSKGEAMANRLNVPAQEFSNIAAATKAGKITPHEIHAALAMAPQAERLNEVQQGLVLYVLTAEPRYRSSAKAELLVHAAGLVLTERWYVKKRGILTAAAEHAADHLVYPRQYRRLTNREWARLLGLSCHKDYQTRWRARVNKLIEHGTELVERAQQQIAGSF